MLKNRLYLFLLLIALAFTAGCENSSNATGSPPKPQLPENFKWEGRWIVRDLGVDVTFSWHGNDGNLQMIAGGEGQAIHFTNLIYDDFLYTLTYKWPGVIPPEDNDNCVCIGKLPLEVLNSCLQSSRYVGAEVLLEEEERYVDHFRVSVVLGDSESKPNPIRLPIMEGDFYVDQEDSTRMWKVLHYGLQNLLDPALDEWAVMQNIENTPGEVNFPPECEGKCTNDNPAFGDGFFCK